MSRIGKVPVKIPSGVEVTIDGQVISVKGPKGDLSQEFSSLAKFSMSEETLVVSPADDSRAAQAVYGTARSIIANMVQGVVTPFTKNLLIEGVGFRATVKGTKIDLELGFSHPILHDIADGVTVTVADNVKIHVEGADKLLKLNVDLGDFGTKEIFSGIKKFYKSEDLVGKKTLVVENLEPKEMKFGTSSGMVLAADSDGDIIVLELSKNINNGSKVK